MKSPVNTQEKYPDDNWIEKQGSGELKFNMNLQNIYNIT